jgi:UDP-glucuronate decarboxylase
MANKSFLESDIAEICKNFGSDAAALSGKRILLVGARGFLGRYFTEVLAYLNANVLAKPCSVVAVDNLITSGETGAVFPNFPHMKFETRDIVKPFEGKGHSTT